MQRLSVLLVLFAVAGCRHGAARPAVAVSDDGRAAIVGGQRWLAPEGVTFFHRSDALHVVSLVPGATFDFAVALDETGRAAVPASAPFEVRDGLVVLRGRSLAPTALLVESGQLYPHDDHFHLTHRWQNEDWRALYRDREEEAGLPGATQQAAAYVLAVLLDRRLPGTTEEATASALRRMAETVARARRAVEGRLPAKQIMAMAVHDLEILDGGASLVVEGKSFQAGPGVRFAYCGDHFHVEEATGAWAHVVPLDDVEPGAFVMPPSMFYEVSGATVLARQGPAAWKDLLARGEIRLVGDRWFVTESYALPALQRLEKLAFDGDAPQQVRELARRSVLEVMKLPLDIESDAAFHARLVAVDGAVEARWRELEPRAARPASKRR